MLLAIVRRWTLASLVLAPCVQAGVANADVLGIPRDSQFPNAHYPYARTVSGCTEWRQPKKAAAKWGDVDFDGACEQHDQCFHTLGRTWGECNQDFLSALRNSCDRDLKAAKLAAGQVGEPDPQALHLCYEIADLYFARVQDRAAVKRYELAQKQQGAYLRYVRSSVQRAYVTTHKRPATEAEEADALRRLDEGVPLARIAGSRARVAQVAAESGAETMFPVIDESRLSGLEGEAP